MRAALRDAGGKQTDELRAANIATVEEFFDRSRRYAALAAPTRRENEPPEKSEAQMDGPESIVMSFLVPAVGKLCAAEDQCVLHRAGFYAVLAAERFQRQTGSYPASWDDLIARGLLSAPPSDPFSGQTLRYKLLAAPDDQNRAYWVYSVGVDGADDGGNEAPRRYGALHGSPQNNKGFDYVTNRSDKPR